VSYDFEKGCVLDEYVSVDVDKIKEESETLRTWLKERFPDSNIGWMIYGHYN
jgi:hypothetical protein